MPLKTTDIRKQIETTLKEALGEHWSDVASYGKIESKKIVDTISFISKEHASGRIDTSEARLLLRMQLESARSVLLTVQGMSIVTTETALNRAIDAVGSDVNQFAGFNLCDTGGSRDH